MKSSTCLEIDLRKIEENSRRVREKCADMGIEVLGVTKGFAALPRIVAAMKRGGIRKLADARLENIIELRKRRFSQSMTLLRLPRLSVVHDVIKYADCSVNSEYLVIKALSDTAAGKGIHHDIILMIDVGDLREGVLPEEAADLAKKTASLTGVIVRGIGTNMGCYGGVIPTEQNLQLLLDIKKEIEEKASIKLDIVSGGGTSSLKLVDNGTIPRGINQLRIGEGILLGTDTTHDYEIPWLHQDAFMLRTEVIEVKSKPSVPIGETGRDAFGNKPVFEDKGLRKRAILALGKQDVNIEGLIPTDKNMQILGASSDHLIIDVTDSEENTSVGDTMTFRLNYQGLLTSSNSRYIRKKYL
jgi:predicted amino acid racemase